MADVCLILEGTYPYVTGGVSSCVYQQIRQTPHIKYALLYIGPTGDVLQEYKYPIPDNVELIKEVFLFDYNIEGDAKPLGIDFDWNEILTFHKELDNKNLQNFEKIFRELFDSNTRKCDPIEIFTSKEAWDLIKKLYNKRYQHGGDAPPFIDYFYTWRFTHFPLFQILKTELPQANIYHSMCTGYAGLLGAVASMKYRKPFVLTEHGIYSHEREIEISQAEWVFNTDEDLRAKKNMSVFKEWWIKLFHFMSLITYERADLITTLYNGNKLKQIKYGANEDKIQIIPNGIDIEKFGGLEITRNDDDVLRVALVGRVVPIKDIKTFIKASNAIVKSLPKVEIYIIGPTEEDELYYSECQTMVSLFELEKNVFFTGRANVKEYYPKMDLLVLSSISEGQPLVILEAYCCELPVVATDVGSCSELIFGMNDEDKELGPSGDVVPFGSPDKLATACINILRDKPLREKMGKAALKRVETYYREDIMINRYLNVYNHFISQKI
jgi:glycosyltransferase involved in cell wall biosynthesis